MCDVIWVWEPMAREWVAMPNSPETIGALAMTGHCYFRGSTIVGPPDDGPNGEDVAGTASASHE